VRTPAAADPPASKTRLRPLIYVYDLPPAYNTRMMQVRLACRCCAHEHALPIMRVRMLLCQLLVTLHMRAAHDNCNSTTLLDTHLHLA
jgi:hypothetical protein